MITLKEIQTRFNNLAKDAEKAIIDAMVAQNVECISFATNGDNSNFDVDKAYATVYVDRDYECLYKSCEIIAVYTDGKNLEIITIEDEVSFEQLNHLETPIFAKGKFKYNLFQNERGYNVFTILNETYDYISALSSLAETIDEVLNGILKGQVITDNVLLDDWLN